MNKADILAFALENPGFSVKQFADHMGIDTSHACVSLHYHSNLATAPVLKRRGKKHSFTYYPAVGNLRHNKRSGVSIESAMKLLVQAIMKEVRAGK